MDISKVAGIPPTHTYAISTSEGASFQTLNEQLKKLDDVRAQTDELLPQLVQPLLPLPHLHLHGLHVAAALHPLVDLPVAHFLGLDWQHFRVYDLERS